MTYLLILYLGLADPAGNEQAIVVEPEICALTAADAEAGNLTRARLNDGRIALVVRAECMGPVEAAEATQ